MEFRTLEHISIPELTHVFNVAFSDYVVPIKLTEPLLQENIIRDNLDLKYSVGAFEGKDLVGFILQGIGFWNGKKTAYNGGTGVIQAARGRKIAQQLYAFSMPYLKAQGVAQCLLEVITTNLVAIKTYETIGFKKLRDLFSFRGEPNFLKNEPLPVSMNIVEVDSLDWDLVQSFWNYGPSWSYSVSAATQLEDRCKKFALFREKNLIGYAVLLRSTNRLLQLAVAPEHRQKGYGMHLLNAIMQNNEMPLTVINTDYRNKEMIGFLEGVGLVKFLSQHEMVLAI